MQAEALHKLVEQARQDPAFFHALVFDTESVLTRLDYLDRETKAALVAISPEEAFANFADRLAACGGGETCSCTSATCGGTCGGSTCSVTCSADSCGRTCDNSCGYTTNLASTIGRRFGRP